MKVNQISKDYWLKRFGEAYQLKWKDEGKSQEAFANAINRLREEKEANGIKGTCSPQQVSKWRNNTVPSQENIALIIELLDLPADYFEPSKNDLYKNSSKYITEVGRKIICEAEEAGSDLDFVKGLRGVVDFDKHFPIYAPLAEQNPGDLLSTTYGRKTHAESAPIDKDLEFLQIRRNGKTITLSLADLAFLREVQDEVARYVHYLFYKRAELMDDIVDKVNDDSKGRYAFNNKKLAEYDKPLLKGVEEKIICNTKEEKQ